MSDKEIERIIDLEQQVKRLQDCLEISEKDEAHYRRKSIDLEQERDTAKEYAENLSSLLSDTNIALKNAEQQLSDAKEQLEAMKVAYKKANDQLNEAGDVIHYLDKCWDKAAYPTLAEALEHLTFCGMPECKADIEAEAIRKVRTTDTVTNIALKLIDLDSTADLVDERLSLREIMETISTGLEEHASSIEEGKDSE